MYVNGTSDFNLKKLGFMTWPRNTLQNIRSAFFPLKKVLDGNDCTKYHKNASTTYNDIALIEVALKKFCP